MSEGPPNPVYRTLGGRKATAGLIAFLALTVMAFPLDATFPQYMTGILSALGITGTLVAGEDVAKRRYESRSREG